MRILHVVPTFFPAWRHGGPVRAVDGLARAQARLGHEVAVFTTHRNGEEVLDVPTDRPVYREGVEVRYFALSFPRRIDRAPRLARELEGRLGTVDVVHLHSVFLWPTWAAARAARRHGVPYLLSPRGILAPALVRTRGALRKRLWIELLERRNLEGAAAVHATSELEAREIAGLGLRLRSLVVVPNGVDLPDRPLPASRPPGRLLFLGRVSWKKGIDRLIDALAHLPGVELVVAGPDDEELTPALHERAGRAGVASRVTFAGAVDDRERDRLFAQSALLALPSRSENFGNVVVEAMAAGLPVVVTSAVGAAELVRAAGGGEVVPEEPMALATAIDKLLAEPERLAAMGCASRRYVEEHLGWPRVAAEMVAAYAAAGAQERAV